jgi:hypothetical protein
MKLAASRMKATADEPGDLSETAGCNVVVIEGEAALMGRLMPHDYCARLEQASCFRSRPGMRIVFSAYRDFPGSRRAGNDCRQDTSLKTLKAELPQFKQER